MYRQFTFLILMLALLFVTSSCTQAGPPDNQGQLGSTLYADNCAGCHGAEGTNGDLGPRLAGNNNLQSPENVIDRVLGGGGPMPPFATNLSDTQIAAVVSHIRISWGNSFGRVTTSQVAAQRSANLSQR